MPRTLNPGTITVGPGKDSPDQVNNLVLIGAGMGASPNVGVPGHIPLGGTLPGAYSGWPKPIVDEGVGGAELLGEHVVDAKNAHPAVSISIDGHPDLITSQNVEGALDELMGAIPAEPPKVGAWFPYMTVSGVPDWGKLRLADQPIATHQDMGNSLTGTTIYPYYWVAPTPTQDAGFASLPGMDPATDPVWNGNVPALVGGSDPQAVAGALTDLADQVVVRTRLLPPFLFGGLPDKNSVNLSGMIYPADRGVVALLHWPWRGDVGDFLAQDLLDRCWGALLLGQGLNDGACISASSPITGELCDGWPGGIFEIGETGGNYDPFAFPGRATGQYDLHELHTGVSDIDGTAIPAPWPKIRLVNSQVPGAGQVRLGTVLAAGVPVEPYGIPILGANLDAYDPITPPPDFMWGLHRYVGHLVLLNSNFYRYRLPYLADYSAATGLKYTPKGANILTTREAGRFYDPATPYNLLPAYIETVGGLPRLKQAGAYTNYAQDYWTWQLARLRQNFWVDSVAGGAVAGDNFGTLWLIHFKTEADFEKLVRDGILPWDVTDGYDVYGVSLVDDPIGDYENIVNQDPNSGLATDFPAPDYGYGSRSYHILRTHIGVLDDATVPSVDTNTWDYTIPIPGNVGVVQVSGVTYLTPTIMGVQSFEITDLDFQSLNFWQPGYRADDNPLTGDAPPAAPAQVSSPNPAFLGLAHFSYGLTAGLPSFTIPPAGFTDLLGTRLQRVEFPYPYLGTHGGNPFSETNGPGAADALDIILAGSITPTGDLFTPAFSTNAAPRVFLRKPWLSDPIQPSSLLNGRGSKLVLPVPADRVLFHSGYFDGTDGQFGNYLIDLVDFRTYDCLNTAGKDVVEPFLDEVYRIRSTWDGVLAAEKSHLVGPGMQGWLGVPIPVPVRMGNLLYTGAAEATWMAASWTHQVQHTVTIPAAELQVMGLPDRNPQPTNWVPNPFPSAGLLGYPKADYTTNFRPTLAETGLLQFNYSGEVGTRSYIRCLDAAFSHNVTLYTDVAGDSFILLRVDGLTLADFQYAAPGPGQLANILIGIAVEVKIPGLTTWMDLGRLDGDGPSKQDGLLDGAGCKVAGPYTYTGVDPLTGLAYSQVKVHVGPAIGLAHGVSFIVGPDTYFEIPVLVRVRMTAASKPYDLTTEATTPGVWAPAAGTAARTQKIRGITGIQIIHPTRWQELTTDMATRFAALL